MSTLRSIPLSAEIGSAETKSFVSETGRPLLIVGNGPSSAMPPYDRIPADPVVFRMNWFFLEGNYHFGNRVDAWFSAIPNETLERLLQDEIRSGRYDVRRILTPMRRPSHRDDDHYGLPPLPEGVEEFDSWSIPAHNPRLARHFMSRPGLPTTGMQALAFGLGVGFREIYLSGIDLYESTDRRYGYAVPQTVEAALQQKDLAPGYEAAHGIDTDLAFLRSCLAEYPDARIRSVSSSATLHLYVKPADPVTDGPAMSPDETIGRPKDQVDVVLPEAGGVEAVVVPKVDKPMWTEIDGRKCAYVTVVSGEYHHGARALANSLRRVTDVPLIALCTPDTDRAALAASGIRTIEVPGILNPALTTDGRRRRRIQGRFAMTYTKLHAFRLDFLDRVVYVDADAVVRHNIDELFEGDDFAAVPDAGLKVGDGRIFNSGVFACTPSHELFEKMIKQLTSVSSYDGGDQGFLNVFFDEWRPLPPEFNTTKRMFSHHAQLFQDADVKVLHYVGVKPWERSTELRYDELDYDWLTYLEDWEKNELIRALRRGPGTEDGIVESTGQRKPKPWTPDSALRKAYLDFREGNPQAVARRFGNIAKIRQLTEDELRVYAIARAATGNRRKAAATITLAPDIRSKLAIGSSLAVHYAENELRQGVRTARRARQKLRQQLRSIRSS